MKKKSKKAIIRKKKEFRYHKIPVKSKNGKTYEIYHPTYVFLEKGNIYIYVSITHSNHINDKIIIQLRQNPNPKDKRESYWVAKIKNDRKDTFGKREKNWKIDPQDDEDIRNLKKKDDSVD